MVKKILLVVLIVSVGVAVWVLFFRKSTEPVEVTRIEPIEQTNNLDESIDEAPSFDEVEIQKIVEQWSQRVGGNASIVIIDPQNPDETIASHRPDEVYFAASLYKLFVVYSGYQKLDDGTFSADEEYLYGQSREECLDKAIRSSDSPCAETWWNELGKEELTTQMAELGMTQTSLTGLSTTASDVATMMTLIWLGEGISNQAREQYLDSLYEQDALYRRGLPSGFSENVKVYNKVGWNLTREWHDGAIVDFGNDRVLVVAVLTENVGMNNIAELASALETTVKERSE